MLAFGSLFKSHNAPFRVSAAVHWALSFELLQTEFTLPFSRQLGRTINMLAFAVAVGEAQLGAPIWQVVPASAIGEGHNATSILKYLLQLPVWLPCLLHIKCTMLLSASCSRCSRDLANAAVVVAQDSTGIRLACKLSL